MRQVFKRRTAIPCSLARTRGASRRLQFESLESRIVMDATPFGATDLDTSEFMLGSVTATVVLLESNGAIDANLENWTPASIQSVKERIAEALTWWEDLLDAQGSVHDLTFHIDFAMADQPVASSYEPIAGSSLNYLLWVDEFLDLQGIDPNTDFYDRGRLFNNTQRQAHETNWAFTIFVVNDDLDVDDRFAGAGASGGFAVPDGGFIVIPASRPASTFAHEVGHVFWALDEYPGGRSYYDSRGYYNTQNTNGYKDHPQPSTREVSIMDNQVVAFPLDAISQSAREMIGWKDSDGDGVFDVADVPLTLTGTGAFDQDNDTFRFVGSASVNTLLNRNPAGRQSDITLNEVSRLQVRFDSGEWSDLAEIHAYQSQLDVEFSTPVDVTSLELRVIDDATGITSDVFVTNLAQPSAVVDGSVQGFVWFDENGNQIFDSSESPDVSAVVRLLNSMGSPLPQSEIIAATHFTTGELLGVLPSGIELQAITPNAATPSLSVAESSGDLAFAYRTGTQPWSTLWTSESPELKVALPQPNSYLAVEISGGNIGGYGRITAYDAEHRLLTRVTTDFLAPGANHRVPISAINSGIAYIIVEAHGPGDITIHSVQIGVETTTPVNAMGAYSLAHFPPGVYKVAVASSNAEMTSPDRHIYVNPGATLSNVNFALVAAPSWRNSNLLGDVDGDGWETSLDLAYLVKELHRAGPRSLVDLPPLHNYLVDLDGDNYVTSVDLALLVRALKNRPLTVESAEPGEAENTTAPLMVVSETSIIEDERENEQGYLQELVVHPSIAPPQNFGFVDTIDGTVVRREGYATSYVFAVSNRVSFVDKKLRPLKRLDRVELHDACFEDYDFCSPFDKSTRTNIAAGPSSTRSHSAELRDLTEPRPACEMSTFISNGALFEQFTRYD